MGRNITVLKRSDEEKKQPVMEICIERQKIRRESVGSPAEQGGIKAGWFCPETHNMC